MSYHCKAWIINNVEVTHVIHSDEGGLESQKNSQLNKTRVLTKIEIILAKWN